MTNTCAKATTSGMEFICSYGYAEKSISGFVTTPATYKFVIKGRKVNANTSSAHASLDFFIDDKYVYNLSFMNTQDTDQVVTYTIPSNYSHKFTFKLNTFNSNARPIVSSMAVYRLDITPSVSPSPTQSVSGGAVKTGNYRNVLKEHLFTDQQINQRIDELWKAAYVDGKIAVVEGNSYPVLGDHAQDSIDSLPYAKSMLIAVMLDKKDAFNNLWNTLNPALFDPQTKLYYVEKSVKPQFVACCAKNYETSQYVITALMLADKRWGSNTAIDKLDYKKHALVALSGLKSVDNVGNQVNYPFSSNTIMKAQEYLSWPYVQDIAYTPNVIVTSMNINKPAFYELWYHYTNDPFWSLAAKQSRLYFRNQANPTNFLTRDFSDTFGKYTTALVRDEYNIKYNNTTHPQDYAQLSWKGAMNIALDYEWWRADTSWTPKYSDTLLRKFGITPYTYPSYYQYATGNAMNSTRELQCHTGIS